MSDAVDPCGTMGPEAVAFARGEIPAGSEGSVRAHLASCPACAALVEDVLRIRAAAAAREVPAAPPGSAERLAAALDRAVEEADAADRARGPVVRLLERASRRYAESRKVRFLVFSLGAHAAAAVALAVWLTLPRPPDGFRPGAPGGEETVDVAMSTPLPPVYPDADPLYPAPAPPPRRGPEIRSVADLSWPDPGLVLGTPEAGRFDETAIDLGTTTFRLYPGEEMRAFAAPRFRKEMREGRLVLAYGPVEGPRASRFVEQAARYLASAQDPDGTWASGRPGDPRPQRDRFRGGVTGTVLLAFLGDGRTAMRPSTYAANVRAAVTALVGSQDPKTGLLGGFGAAFGGDRPLCNHGPALAALAEAYGLDFGLLPAATREELSRAIGKAVAATLRSQLADGSFGYSPAAKQGDASVTLLQVEGLQSARRAGFEVDPVALRRAGAWLGARIGADGRLGYREAGDRSRDATLTAQALPLAGGLGLAGEARERMLAVVEAEARNGSVADRILFRTAFLEAIATSAGADARTLASSVARASMDGQDTAGIVAAARDPYAAAAGDALATARTARALTAPYRVAP